jgi:protoheme IX farnesyltransferase
MLPVVAGPDETRRQILIYAIVLAPIGAAPWLLGHAGSTYGAVATAGGLLMVALAWRLWRSPSRQIAQRLFAFSILYLFLLFATLLVEQALGGLLSRTFA